MNDTSWAKKTAVVFMASNRPAQTQAVVDALRHHKVENLLILCDTPNSAEQPTLANEVRRIVDSIDWTVPRVFQQTSNKDQGSSIVDAVNSAFERFDAVIVLENGCVPKNDFFDYHFACLHRYAEESRVMGVSGHTTTLPPQILEQCESDVYFLPRPGNWGWSTWKDRWVTHDRNLARTATDCLERGLDLEKSGSDVPNLLGDALLRRCKESWMLPWLLNGYLKNALYVYPKISHVEITELGRTGGQVADLEHRIPSLSNPPLFSFPPAPEVSDTIQTMVRAELPPVQRFYTDATLRALAKAHSLKVVHLCAQDHGGAGTAAVRLHQALCNAGVSSSMLVLSRRSQEANIHSVGTQADFLNRLDSIARAYPARSPAFEIFSDGSASLDLTANRLIQEADIINLHWVPGMLDHSKLGQLFGFKPLVWTLHDMNPFTGGCHYNSGCRKFEQQCGACPQLASNSPEDLSFSNFIGKVEGYRNLNLHIVTPSRWLLEEARKSKLMGDFPATVIPNGFPIELFFPLPVAQVRQLLGIPVERPIVLFGCEHVLNTRKGFKHVLKTFNILSEEGAERPLFCFFGHLPPEIQLPSDFKSLGTIKEIKLLSAIYSMADVFLIPSLEDNLPNVVPEALLAGTPVVGFDVGGIPEMILHKRTGYIAPVGDADELANGVRWVLRNKTEEMSALCRNTAAARFSQEIQAVRYLETYSELMERHQGESTRAPSHQPDPKGPPTQLLVNLGCGSRFHPLWNNFDLDPADNSVTGCDLRHRIPLPASSADVVYHSHLLEHLTKSEGVRLMRDCYRVLKPGGIIRVVVPDLEQIARIYLEKLEQAIAGDDEVAHDYEWILVELLDSMTRSKPGGAMLDWWTFKELHGDAFVRQRLGSKTFDALSAVRNQGLLKPNQDLEQPEALGKFRLGGEVHLWMYDRYSLKRLLTQSGFSRVSQVSASGSKIPGFENFFLDCDQQGQLLRPDSLFFEAEKVIEP